MSLLDIFGNSESSMRTKDCNKDMSSITSGRFKKYTAEGVELFYFSMVDNSGVVDVLEGKLGIISSLNEECMRPKRSPLSFVYKAKMMHCDSLYMLSNTPQEVYKFGIKHFVGPVTYDASDLRCQ